MNDTCTENRSHLQQRIFERYGGMHVTVEEIKDLQRKCRERDGLLAKGPTERDPSEHWLVSHRNVTMRLVYDRKRDYIPTALSLSALMRNENGSFLAGKEVIRRSRRSKRAERRRMARRG